MSPNPDVKDFFEQFAEDFTTFDGTLIAQRYGLPYLALSGQGQAQLFTDEQQIGEYFQQVLDDYFKQGCRTCRFRELQINALGRHNLFASLTWELLDQAGVKTLSWRESYVLTRTPAGLRIHSSTDHAD